MADSFLNGSAVAGIDIKIRPRSDVPPAPASEGVNNWIEITITPDRGPISVIHLHAGSADSLRHRLTEIRERLFALEMRR